MRKKSTFNGKSWKYRLNITHEQEKQFYDVMQTLGWLYNTTLAYQFNDYKYAKNNVLTDMFGSLRKIELGYPNISYNLDYLKLKVPNEAYKLGGPVKDGGAAGRSTYTYYKYLKLYARPEIMREKLNSIPAIVSQDVLRRVGLAFNAFFKGGGYPRFKSKPAVCSITFTSSISLNSNILTLPKPFGDVKLKLHRNLPEDGIIKLVTITRNSLGEYYVSIAVHEPQKNFNKLDEDLKILAIDRNIKLAEDSREFGVTYDGITSTKILMPIFVKDATKEITKIQQKMSNLTLNSPEWLKQLQKKRHIEEKMLNRKRNWIQNLTYELVKQYDYIILEDLDILSMTNKNKAKSKASRHECKSDENDELKYARKIRKGFNEVNHGEFLLLLDQKLKYSKGRNIIKVPSKNTSKQCHVCNYINKDLSLDVREWSCPQCNTTHDRDINAAHNIYNLGLGKINSSNQIID
jgi:putative transposase